MSSPYSLKCSSCSNDLRHGDRFCGLCGKPILKLLESSSSETPKIGIHRRKGKRSSSKIEDRAVEMGTDPDLSSNLNEKGAALGAALAEELLPGNQFAKGIGIALGRRLAEKMARTPLIAFGTDAMSVALAKARSKAIGKGKKRKKGTG